VRRRALIVLFALGTVGGFGSGLAHSRRCRGESWRAHSEWSEARRDRLDRHTAEVCERAAREAVREERAGR
jgi:hypothetical protein